MASDPTIKAVVFDFYQTIVEIKTDEKKIELWRVLASFLQYRGADVTAEDLRTLYFRTVEELLDRSAERHPEVDAGAIFSALLEQTGLAASADLTCAIAQLFRSLSIEGFRLYPESREVLETLAGQYRLALVSDSQTLYLEPELRLTSLANLFEVVVSSSLLRYRKPDPRMFQTALSRMNLAPENVVYVGDSWERDMVGARNAGIQGIWVCRSANQLAEPRPFVLPVIADLRELLPLLGHVPDRL
jgi:putative hydrolase of the HAD superfamily